MSLISTPSVEKREKHMTVHPERCHDGRMRKSAQRRTWRALHERLRKVSQTGALQWHWGEWSGD